MLLQRSKIKYKHIWQSKHHTKQYKTNYLHLFKIQSVYHRDGVQALVLVPHSAKRVGVVVPQAPAAQVNPGALPQTADADDDHVLVRFVLSRLQAVGYFRRHRLAGQAADFRIVDFVLQALAQDFRRKLLDFVRFEARLLTSMLLN